MSCLCIARYVWLFIYSSSSFICSCIPSKSIILFSASIIKSFEQMFLLIFIYNSRHFYFFYFRDTLAKTFLYCTLRHFASAFCLEYPSCTDLRYFTSDLLIMPENLDNHVPAMTSDGTQKSDHTYHPVENLFLRYQTDIL